MRAAPGDRSVRDVYADYLLEHGDPRGEWIALHRSNTEEAELKRRALWQCYGASWRAQDTGIDVLGRFDRVRYRDGIVDEVRIGLERLAILAPILATHPIRALGVYKITDLEALAALPVLETVERLELGPGLETANATEILAVLNAAPRLVALKLSPYVEVQPLWNALERFDRLVLLKELDVSRITLPVWRAKWLARAMPMLRSLRWDAGMTDAGLQTIADAASFELTHLSLCDRDRAALQDNGLLTDAGVATVLESPFARQLDTLSISGCVGGPRIANALTRLPCASRLTALTLGWAHHGHGVRALGDAELPMLKQLGIQNNGASPEDVKVLVRFPAVTELHADRNSIGRAGVHTILDAMPNLELLSLADNRLGEPGISLIAHSERVAKLRHLVLSGTHCSTDAVRALIDGGKLTELRTLKLGGNADIELDGIEALACGPFDKLAHLEISGLAGREHAPLFVGSWLPADELGDLAYHRHGEPGDITVQRRLALDGTAVPHVSKPKPRPHDFDQRIDYVPGEHVRHPRYGVVVVSVVTPLAFELTSPRYGTILVERTPQKATPFDPKTRFAEGDIVVHPTYGYGVVISATAGRATIEFAVAGTRTLES